MHRAPERRVDNVVTRLYEGARALHMHAAVAEEARRRYARERWVQWSAVGGALATGQALAIAGVTNGLPLGPMAALSALSAAAALGGAWHVRRSLAQTADALGSAAGLDACFRHTHSRALSDGDSYAEATWARIAPQLRRAVDTLGLPSLPRVSAAELARVAHVADTEVPRLRRLSAPNVSLPPKPRALAAAAETEARAPGS